MSKDPAFLFYSADFLVGVSDMTMEERGQYITLMCLQHTKGHLSEKNIQIGVGSVSKDVISKFTLDENGLYYNERLEKEVKKRKAYSESRKRNGIKRWENNSNNDAYADENECICSPYAYAQSMHTENENVIININDIEINKYLKDTFNTIFDLYPSTTKNGLNSIAIKEFLELNPSEEECKQMIDTLKKQIEDKIDLPLFPMWFTGEWYKK